MSFFWEAAGGVIAFTSGAAIIALGISMVFMPGWWVRKIFAIRKEAALPPLPGELPEEPVSPGEPKLP